MEDKGGTRLWKADPPTKGSQKESRCTNKGSKKEYNGRHLETRPLGRRTCHPHATEEHEKGYNGKQRETRPSGRRGALGDKGRQEPWEDGHTIQEGAQWETRPPPSNKEVLWETKGDKTFGKAETQSNTKADTSR